MRHLLIALTSIPHLHAIMAVTGTVEVSVLTFISVRVRRDMLGMRAIAGRRF